MESNVNVAVLLCIYNGDTIENFDLALRSINEQNIVNSYVYLHIDGHISDDFERYLDENEELIYKTIRSPINIGLARGLNKLILELEDEDFIFRMDADDISNPFRFAKQINFLKNNPDVEACGGYIDEFVGNPDNVIFIRKYPTKNSDIIKKISRASPFAHVTMCFKKNFFKKYGLYPEQYPFNEDIALWFESLKKGAVFGNLSESLVKVRMDGAYERRRTSKAWPELKIYLNIAIWKKEYTIWPFLRFAFRLMPPKLVEKIYNSRMRTRFVE